MPRCDHGVVLLGRHASQTTVLRIGGAGMSNKTSGFKRAIGIVLGVITMLVLIALFVVLSHGPHPQYLGG